MTIVILLAVFCAGALAGWCLALARAGTLLSRVRAGMAREVRHWQEAAERSASEAERIAREAESWRAGWHQGRDDAMSIRPPLPETAGKRVPGPRRAALDGSDVR